jgi:VanZ family protein
LSRLSIKYWLAVFLYAALIFYLSSIPAYQIPQNLPLSDYFLHMVEYLPFGFLVFKAIKKTNTTLSVKKVFIASLLTVILYAISDELHQLFVPGRCASVWDFASDAIGALIGMRIAI